MPKKHRKKIPQMFAELKKVRTFATANEKQRIQRKRVPWMSRLVSSLQDLVRRF